MTEAEILSLLLRHDEDGLEAALHEYGARLHGIAENIVGKSCAEECVNDALLAAWDAIPPTEPVHLRAYLCKLTRNAALNRYRADTARKRGGGAICAALDELAECLPAAEGDPASQAELQALTQALNGYLHTLKPRNRNIFLARYYFAMPLRDIAARFRLREGAVKSVLRRTREGLREFLEKESFL